MSEQKINITLKMDLPTRERLRALCHEFHCSAAHVIRQLILREYRDLFPNDIEVKPMPARALDKLHRSRAFTDDHALRTDENATSNDEPALGRADVEDDADEDQTPASDT
jgi:hypothetical protein